MDRKRSGPDANAFRSWVGSLRLLSTAKLLDELGRATDPLAVWCVHVALNARAVPPVVRPEPAEGGPQFDFIAFAADVEWLRLTWPEHKPKFAGWLKNWWRRWNDETWQTTVYSMWLRPYKMGQMAYLHGKGLALSEAQRQHLVTVPTASMAADRRKFMEKPFRELGVKLRTYTREHPDRSGKHDPVAIAKRRASLFRYHVLLGRSPVETQSVWHAVSGEAITRQAISKQIANVEDALRWWRRKHG